MADSLLLTPLLLWVDDHVETGDSFKLINYAKNLGIHVYTMKTTDEAEEWILHNLGI